MKKERILVTVKTYPTISRSYVELVCSAGLNQNGQWIRLYPIQFRKLQDLEQYKKYDWIECDLVRNTKDFRIESHRPFDPDNIKNVGHIGTENAWQERNEIVLDKAEVFENLTPLITKAKSERISLTVYKPKEIIKLHIRENTREYDEETLKTIEAHRQQDDVLGDNEWRSNFKIVHKLPRTFAYEFVDQAGSSYKMRILDWEIGALFWKSCAYKEEKYGYADEQVRKKYWSEFMERDIYLFLGTTLDYHMIAPNPFTIVGVYYPPKPEPIPLFDSDQD